MKAQRAKRVAAKSIREKNVATFAKKTGEWAIKKASEKKIPVTVAKDKGIYKIYSDGTKELISQRPQKVRVSQKIIKLSA